MIAIKPVSSFDMLHQVGLLGGWVGKKIGILYEWITTRGQHRRYACVHGSEAGEGRACTHVGHSVD